MFPVGLNIQICVHDISIIFVCACVHRDWRFEAFVDVKIPGAGDDLLSMYVCMYICMVITYSRVWINRVRLPILLVVN